MAYMQSPGIQVKEYDLTTYVPGVASTEAGIGGVFSWGPVEDIQLVSNENELVQQFGRPTEDNYETFLIASNFLSYSDALYVSRAADANAYNAVANTGTVPTIQVLNDDDFTTKQSSISANAVYIASYPGTLGNSLKVSVCDSANAYTSTFTAVSSTSLSIGFVRDSFTADIVVTDTVGSNTAVANTALNDITTKIQTGDVIKAYSADVGSQFLKVKAVGSGVSGANGVMTSTITFENRFQLAANVSMTSFSRFWEFHDLVDRAPATSLFTGSRGGAGDELHIAVIDEDGKVTGTPGVVLEVWKNLSRVSTAVGEQNGSIYFKDVINNSSRYIRAVADRPGAVTVSSPAASTAVNTLPLTVSFAGGTDSLSESAIGLTHLARAYDKFKNEDDVDVSILIAGKATGGTHGEALANYIVDNIAEVRRDLVVTISPAVSDVVNNPYQEAEDIIQFRSALRKSSYAMISTTYKYQYDRYADKYRWIAGCGDDAGLIARTDKDRDPWWSPAGHNRGVYKNLVKLAYNPSQADRDLLYRNDVNPSVTMKGSGSILYGDKTLYGMPSAFDRINVRRLFITLEKAIKIAARAYLFEFNDEFTRARFRNMVTPYLRDVQGRRGITDFKVVCDESNNTAQVIDTNNFIGDIYIKPARSINFITLNFVAVGTGVAFDYVIGKF